MTSINERAILPSLAPTMEREMPEECLECGQDDIVENWKEGTAECRCCGLVIKERLLDLGTEWRDFTSEERGDLNLARPNRVGPPANPLLDGEQGTSIGGGFKGGSALSITLNRAQERNATSVADKMMTSIMGQIDLYCDRLSLPGSISKRAKELFKIYRDHLTLKKRSSIPDKYARSRALRQREVNKITAASLNISCRTEKAARTYKEICGLTRVPEKAIGATVKKIELALDGAKTVYVRGTDDFVSRVCNLLVLPREIINAAAAVANAMQKYDGLRGKPYTTVAAASIYVVTQLSADQHKRSPKQIGKVAGVADVTVRSTYRLIRPYIGKILPPDFKNVEPLSALLAP